MIIPSVLLRRALFPVLVLALSFAEVCAAQTTPPDLKGLTLVWSDEFNGTTLDTTKWYARDGEARQGASRWMKKEVSVVNVDGISGCLRLGITATKIPTNDEDTANYDCGAVITMKDGVPLFTQTYGYYEARCKLPARINADYWAAFWMMAGRVADDQPSTQLGHEIDVMESFKIADQGKHKLTMHWNGYDFLGNHNVWSLDCGTPPNLRDGGFHVYGLYWDQNVYISYVDGVEVGRTNFIGFGSSANGRTLSDGTCRQPGRIYLSCEAAKWSGDKGWASPFPASDEFLVDYVRVYTVTDTTPPAISTISPADNATGVAVGTNLVATFSEAIAIGTGNITVKNLSNATQTTIAITDTTQASISGAVLTINPTTNLLAGKNYAIQIAATAIKDLANNPFAGVTNDTTWNFATVAASDTMAPTISALNPADNATDVAIGTNLVATFSENIAIGTGNITLKNLTDATQTTIAVTDAAQASISGAVLTINPTTNLLAGRNYAIQIAATAIKDTAGNSFSGINNDITWNFVTAGLDGTPTTNVSNGGNTGGGCGIGSGVTFFGLMTMSILCGFRRRRS